VSESHDRRSFFKQLLRGAAQTAEEITTAFRGDEPPPTQSEEPAVDDWGMSWGASYQQRPVAAEPAQRTATLDELLDLCRESGLEHRVDDVAAHTRASVRLTPTGDGAAVPAGGTKLGGLPDLPPGFEWPDWRGGDLGFVGQIRLADVAALGGFGAGDATPLPRGGLLLVFFDLDMRPAGLRPEDRGGCRVVLVDDVSALAPAADRVATLAELPVRPSVELTLPSESAGLPRALELDPNDLDAWQRLREALAELQGVEVEDRSFDWHALHRLGGWPDASEEGMEADCELVTNGIDLNAGQRYFDPRVPELEAGADRWRLLLQVSSDDDLGSTFGYPVGRLYVWIRDDDLRAGRFDDVWAFVR